MGRRHGLLTGASLALLLVVAFPLTRLPASGGAVTEAKAPAPAASGEAGKAAWSPDAVSALKGKGQPIFVDFTASWCITCQVNERTTLSTDAVRQALHQTRTVYMVADSTNYNPDIDEAIGALGRGGLPLYVVYPADGGKPEVLPQLLTPDLVVAALQRAASAKSRDSAAL